MIHFKRHNYVLTMFDLVSIISTVCLVKSNERLIWM